MNKDFVKLNDLGKFTKKSRGKAFWALGWDNREDMQSCSGRTKSAICAQYNTGEGTIYVGQLSWLKLPERLRNMLQGMKRSETQREMQENITKLESQIDAFLNVEVDGKPERIQPVQKHEPPATHQHPSSRVETREVDDIHIISENLNSKPKDRFDAHAVEGNSGNSALQQGNESEEMLHQPQRPKSGTQIISPFKVILLFL
ncbi:hypothetical protein DPX39_030056100 [Trypanosoma brucei equiperdum]|uniref:Uncharacterized protein n=1 Tax=Trypanosoma brucei equiperdum TaxID=630700 RepID=A0A3L6LB02_9TRYP|nr:hypothetical protein DPX39_030066100 [Trypanosoma brucei equiperdum]RHW73747.1 hypothetical protein DPX39_030061100 [Trypanosoma brucei equiperdum]RHW73844.1 hypothetical protein DPX39_030071100 [Trypanosoma brucei equiperdum]RHW73889.1 hypothetical protein DPX39_030056100 [Trypanosoma brucei equiperdum]